MQAPEEKTVPQNSWLESSIEFWKQPWVLKSLARYAFAFAVLGVLAGVIVNLLWAKHALGGARADQLGAFKAALMIFPASMSFPQLLRTMHSGIAGSWGIGIFALFALNGLLYAFIGFMIWLGQYRHKLFFVLTIYLLYKLWSGVTLLH